MTLTQARDGTAQTGVLTVERVSGQILDALWKLFLIGFPDGLELKKKKNLTMIRTCMLVWLYWRVVDGMYQTVNNSYLEGRKG